MIKVKNITKKISSKMLLKFISFELKPNKITGLLGANGAGKTTLFRSVAGLSSIDTGEIFLGKKEVSRFDIEKRSLQGLKYVPQEDSLFEELSLLENLTAAIELQFKKIQNKHTEKIDFYLEKMKLQNKANIKAKFLSGGEKRKTEILRAILLDAKCILLDEPFAGVDPISVEEIIKILKDLKENLTIFISDHNFRDVMKVCDEIILMNQGEILLNGPPETVQNDRLAQKLYFGEIN
ncbi:MAG: ATP-binding cassette domain-containing protein [Pseudomonadota bacterium]|jgi:lipopolysaccharide export system ATP-binding protein|nr:ATP-binding cassette domain-containing protein [bacterium]MEC7809301.1 ATP-binding cassette domain-containing protein [Pseudomonadota bacterium]|tara:strand:+ start:1329 stop:2039 length:711 start_codon:yes stop_codon:yes gene_type:complete